MALFVREPFGGITPAVYAALSDRQILDIYLAPRDEDGTLVAEGSSRRRSVRAQRRERLERAWRELPSAAALEIPAEVMDSPVGQRQPSFVRMYWQVWRGRGLDTQQVLARWKADGHPVGAPPRRGRRSRRDRDRDQARDRKEG